MPSVRVGRIGAVLALTSCSCMWGPASAARQEHDGTLRPDGRGWSAPLLPLGLLFAPPERAHVVISGEGGTVAWVGTDPDSGLPQCAVWQADLDRATGLAPAQIAYSGTDRIGALVSVRGAGTLAFSAHEANPPIRRLMAVRLSDQRVLDLTPPGYDDVEIVDTEFVRAHHVLVRGRLAGDPARRDLIAVNVTDGSASTILEDALRARSYFVDGDWTPRVALVDDGAGGSVVVSRSSDEEAWSPLRRWPRSYGRTVGVFGLSRDGREVYMLDDTWDAARGLAGVVAAPTSSADGSTPRAARIIAASRNWLPHALLTRLDTGEPIAAAFTYEIPIWKAVDLAAEEEIGRLRKLGPGEITVVSRTDDDRTWIVRLDSEREPGRHFLWKRDELMSLALFRGSDSLAQQELAEASGFVVPMRDGFTLVTYVTMPVGVTVEGPTPQPTVVLLSDRPWERAWTGYDAVRQWLANRGYVVLVANGRGADGFAARISKAGAGQWGTAMADDIADLVAWAAKRRFADPTKVAIVGLGLGGSAALVAAARSQQSFACVAAIDAPLALDRLRADDSPLGVARWSFVTHAVGSDEPVALALGSPMQAVPRLRRPTLLVAASDSAMAPAAEMREFADELRAQGTEVDTEVLPGARLTLDGAPFEAARLLERFLAQRIGGRDLARTTRPAPASAAAGE